MGVRAGSRCRWSTSFPFGSVRRRNTLGTILLGCCIVTGTVPAVDDTTVSVARLEGPGWVAEDLTVHFSFQDDLALEGEIARLSLPGVTDDAGRIEFTCADVTLYAWAIACPRGTVRWLWRDWDVRLIARLAVNEAGGMDFEFQGEHEQGLSGRGTWARWGWDLRLEAPALAPASLLGADATGAGRVALNATLVADADGLRRAEARVRSAALDFSDAAGNNAAEGLRLQWQLDAEREGTAWTLQLDGALDAGQAYVEPVFLDLEAHPLKLTATAGYEIDTRRGRLSFDVQHAGLAHVSGDGAWDEGSLAAFTVDLVEGQFPGLYDAWLQPFLIGTVLDELETIGQMRGRIRRSGDAMSVSLDVQDLHLDDRRNRLGLYGVNGSLHWDSESREQSLISVSGGHLYRVNLGAVSLPLETTGDSARLQEPVSIPLMDGALNVGELTVENWGGEEFDIRIQAELAPVSLEALTHALNLPVLGGQVYGRIPLIRYARGDLTLDGNLDLKILGGEATFANLQIRDLLGLVPRLQADVTFDGLDLDLVTRAFSFGRVTGRLDGAVEGLELVAWQPVRFNAWFANPENDESRHRISQQAVENLTELGGGISGTLSGTFMRFFEEFRYDRLGLSCRLQNSVCLMDGIEPAARGYYIVKGAGLPRIDVVGFTHRVSWPDLVRRLKRVTRDSSQIIID